MGTILNGAHNKPIKATGDSPVSFSRRSVPPRLISIVEAVGKVPKMVLGRDAEKSEVIECATINDLMLGKGQVTPENYPLIPVRGFFYRLVSRKRRRL